MDARTDRSLGKPLEHGPDTENGVDHEMRYICIDVDDVAEAVRFYGEGIGLSIVKHEKEWAQLKLGEQTFWLMKLPTGQWVILCLRTKGLSVSTRLSNRTFSLGLRAESAF